MAAVRNATRQQCNQVKRHEEQRLINSLLQTKAGAEDDDEKDSDENSAAEGRLFRLEIAFLRRDSVREHHPISRRQVWSWSGEWAWLSCFTFPRISARSSSRLYYYVGNDLEAKSRYGCTWHGGTCGQASFLTQPSALSSSLGNRDLAHPSAS